MNKYKLSLSPIKLGKVLLKNKIVCIKSADPGYDYLFSKI